MELKDAGIGEGAGLRLGQQCSRYRRRGVQKSNKVSEKLEERISVRGCVRDVL